MAAIKRVDHSNIINVDNEGGSNTGSELLVHNPIVILNVLSRSRVVDFFIFAGVCKSWKSFVTDYKQKFMADQPPLIVLRPENDRTSWYFCNIFDGSVFKTIQPDLVDQDCVDISCGYLFMEDRNIWHQRDRIGCENPHQLRLLNPFTGNELQFPSPPKNHSHAILTSTISDLRFTILAFSTTCLQFCRFGDMNWRICCHDQIGLTSSIQSIAVFKGKAYFITADAKIGILYVNPQPHVSILGATGIDIGRRYTSLLYLVASKEQLLMVHYRPTAKELFVVYKLEMMQSRTMSCQKVESLGDEVLFLDMLNGGSHGLIRSTTANMVNMNCIYYLDSTDHGFLYSLDDKSISDFTFAPQVLNQNEFLTPHLWYFPHQSLDVDSLDG